MRQFLLAFAAFCVLALNKSVSAGTNTKVEWKSCGAATTILTDKNVCYIVDLDTGEKKTVIQICAGANLTSSILGFGGKASTMLCGTIEFGSRIEKQAAIKQAEQILKEKLKDPAFQREFLKKIKSDQKIKEV